MWNLFTTLRKLAKALAYLEDLFLPPLFTG
jgi:hypothetical protein